MKRRTNVTEPEEEELPVKDMNLFGTRNVTEPDEDELPVAAKLVVTPL